MLINDFQFRFFHSRYGKIERLLLLTITLRLIHEICLRFLWISISYWFLLCALIQNQIIYLFFSLPLSLTLFVALGKTMNEAEHEELRVDYEWGYWVAVVGTSSCQISGNICDILCKQSLKACLLAESKGSTPRDSSNKLPKYLYSQNCLSIMWARNCCYINYARFLIAPFCSLSLSLTLQSVHQTLNRLVCFPLIFHSISIFVFTVRIRDRSINSQQATSSMNK